MPIVNTIQSEEKKKVAYIRKKNSFWLSNMKSWFLCLLFISMTVLNHEVAARIPDLSKIPRGQLLGFHSNDQGVLPPPSNPYSRGCQPFNRCRQGSPVAPPGPEIEAKAH